MFGYCLICYFPFESAFNLLKELRIFPKCNAPKKIAETKTKKGQATYKKLKNEVISFDAKMMVKWPIMPKID